MIPSPKLQIFERTIELIIEKHALLALKPDVEHISLKKERLLTTYGYTNLFLS